MSDYVFDHTRYITNGAQLDAKQFAPLRWAVPGLIPEGFGLLTGPPKVGKSWLVGGIALDVGSGSKALGKVPTGLPRPVLYMALEDGERRLQNRCRKLLGEGRAIPDTVDFATHVMPASVDPIIASWLEEQAGTSPLVILDTLARVMPNAVPGESAYSRDYRIGTQLKAHADRCDGATVLVVHHVRKLGGDDWMDSTSGTNGLNGAADFTLNLSRSRNEESGILRATGRDIAEGEYAVTTRAGHWTLDGEALADAAVKAEEAREAQNLGERSAEILAWVNEQLEPVSPKQVVDALDIGDAGRYLIRLADSDRIRKVGRGLYAGVRSVRSVRMDDTKRTHRTHTTPSSLSTLCGEPMMLDDGTGTHPTCEAA